MNEPRDVGLTSEQAPLDIDFTGLSICQWCYRLFGFWRYRSGGRAQAVWEQLCSCSRGPRSERPNWPGFDYNNVVELCKCCGAELLQSGSKWSVWFCDECKRNVTELNGTAGFALISIGRHSIMNGIVLPASAPNTQPVIERFMGRCENLFARMDWLDDRMKLVLKQRLGAADLTLGPNPELVHYLQMLSVAAVDKRCEFEDLRNYFMKRLRAGPEAAQQARQQLVRSRTR